MIDTIYNNRYRLDAIIGEGGMAVVYRGYDLLLRRQVAIKVLRSQYASDESFVQRFYEEARAAAKLSHPNIVNTYDVGEVNGSHYIVEEFVPGETLAALVARENCLPEAVAVRYARQICFALAASHRADLLHRDIKPSNVLITPDDVVRVTDFGIARAMQASASPSGAEAIMGSVPYCSPEQLSGERMSAASDLYSLGVVLFEMVTGKRPYTAETALGVAMAHVSADVPNPSAQGVAVSPDLRDIIQKLLQKAPADRYQSAGEALSALRRCCKHVEEEADEGAAGGDTPTAVWRRRALKTAAGDLPPAAAPAPVWQMGRAVGMAAAVLVAIVAFALVFAAQKAVSRGLTLPDLTGKSQVEAIAALHSVGIDSVSLKQRTDAAVSAGLVDGSSPAPNAKVRPGDAVVLYLSAGPERVRVPDVVGKDVRSATAMLSAVGFLVRVSAPVHSATVKQGMVAQVNPPGNATLEKGSVIALSASLGPLTVHVPNVVSMTDADARSALSRLGLRMIANVMPSVDIPPHTVVDQDPAGGSTVDPGATVTVDISGGPNAVAVPDVVGMSLDDARSSLEQAGLVVGRVAHAVVTDTSAGTIVSQTPSAASQAPQGSAVDVVLAVAPAAASPQTETSPGAAGTATAGPALPPVPNVIGMSVEEARASLEKAGYHVDHVTLLSGGPAGAKVVNTEPEPGATTPPGTTAVNLIAGH
ncbi:MAG: Stk1 family PASTA domain-containing Ser/Thr kinase [Candidatus Eremiobacter antarcticus]|nr:Stk1 family PASTA domain-containing Ser/Thr kinase [Candidatus Eremiobacteraeota bacterium]MBC5807685.1 Stk1 family PASTA domain-containing Ser/Thr kinase [Candidatus Eremiobacteraeota bacterium]